MDIAIMDEQPKLARRRAIKDMAGTALAMSAIGTAGAGSFIATELCKRENRVSNDFRTKIVESKTHEERAALEKQQASAKSNIETMIGNVTTVTTGVSAGLMSAALIQRENAEEPPVCPKSNVEMISAERKPKLEIFQL